ncbi:MAG: hypothetical protein GX133_03330, partial [Syntrophomonadaceae bacterium]|nr:hypothetical protein [Syntrophomonadaceae bacterium]
MGEVHATPHFEVTGGQAGDTNPTPKKGSQSYPVGHGDSPAGVGSVGSIPGPSSTAEAVTGVVVPGLIATALGALGGLGGGGGLIPPTTGTPAFPGGGSGSGPLPGSAPGNGRGPSGTGRATGQIGRRGKDEIFIDTVDVFAEPDGGRGTQSAIIDTADEAGVLVRPASDILIDPAAEAGIIIDMQQNKSLGNGSDRLVDGPEEAGIFVSFDPGLYKDMASEEPGVIFADSRVFADGTDEGIFIDTSAVEAKGGDQAVSGLEEDYNSEGFDKEGFDKDGFDAQGFDKEGFDKDGFDAQGFDKEGFDKEGFDAQGFD